MLTQRQQVARHNSRMEIGTKIKIARKAAGIQTQRALASKLAVSAGLVGAWEAHHKAPGRDNLTKLARLVGKPLSYFIDGTIPDQTAIQTKDPEEVELLQLYRSMPPDTGRRTLDCSDNPPRSVPR